MRILLYISLTFSYLIATSCSDNKASNTVTDIYIDFDNIEVIDLSKGKEIDLEFTDGSMIRRVDELLIYDNKHYVVRSQSDLFVFDENGSFKNRIGQKGSGPMEFTNFSSFFVKNNSVHIYDSMTQKYLIYNWDGTYLNSLSLKDNYTDVIPSYVFPIHNNKFITKNMFGGDNRQLPLYSILDKNLKIISSIANRYLKSGLNVSNNFYADENTVLFWEIFNDTIFSITNDTTYAPKYFVDFNTKSIPVSIKNLDVYDIIDYTNKPENMQKHATLVRCAYEDVHYLRFIFVHNADVYYVKYDKSKSSTQTYKLYYSDKKVEPLILYKDNMLVVPVNSFEDAANPSLVVLDEGGL